MIINNSDNLQQIIPTHASKCQTHSIFYPFYLWTLIHLYLYLHEYLCLCLCLCLFLCLYLYLHFEIQTFSYLVSLQHLFIPSWSDHSPPVQKYKILPLFYQNIHHDQIVSKTLSYTHVQYLHINTETNTKINKSNNIINDINKRFQSFGASYDGNLLLLSHCDANNTSTSIFTNTAPIQIHTLMLGTHPSITSLSNEWIFWTYSKHIPMDTRRFSWILSFISYTTKALQIGSESKFSQIMNEQ